MTETWPPGAIAVVLVFWVGTVVSYPWLTRAAALLVDRAVLRRPDYCRVLETLATELESLEKESDVVTRVAETVRRALGASDVRLVPDGEGTGMPAPPPAGAVVRAQGVEPGRVAVVRLRTVDPPHPSLAIGSLVAGRRLLSDDLQWLEGVGRLTARRLDALRVARERLARDLREQEMERLAAQAELRALRAQLQPHFLFNALTTIGHLIQQAPPRALDTLLRLTSVLRGVLRRTTSEFATLGEEIDLITSYLDIEQARFEERLRVEIDVPADARSLLVPTLLLQPLVENAVRHGIGTRIGGGTVSIRARVDVPVLRIDILDSGTGFDMTRPRREGGVGLRSVSDRLRVHYGADAGLDDRERSGRGHTRVAPSARLGARTGTGPAGGMIAPRLRVVVADDERPARSFLIALLSGFSDIVIVGEAANGAEAIQLIEKHRPDLAMLDLQMPEIDGIGVVRLLRRRYLPLVVFITAFDEYAVKAFEVNAIDYLTKPVSEARLREALRRVHERLEHEDVREAAARGLRKAVRMYDHARPAPRLDRLPIRRRDDIVLCRSCRSRPLSPRVNCFG